MVLYNCSDCYLVTFNSLLNLTNNLINKSPLPFCPLNPLDLTLRGLDVSKSSGSLMNKSPDGCGRLNPEPFKSSKLRNAL